MGKAAGATLVGLSTVGKALPGKEIRNAAIGRAATGALSYVKQDTKDAVKVKSSCYCELSASPLLP